MFTARKETNVRYKRETGESFSETIRFKSPDSWSITSDSTQPATSESVVIVGERAWELRGGMWLEDDPSFYRNTSLSFAVGLSLASSDDQGTVAPGIEIMGQSTSQLTITNPSFGKKTLEGMKAAASLQGLPKAAQDELTEIYRDTKATLELTVGQADHRILAARLTISGPNFNMTQTFAFDYESPVVIDSPAGVFR